MSVGQFHWLHNFSSGQFWAQSKGPGIFCLWHRREMYLRRGEVTSLSTEFPSSWAVRPERIGQRTVSLCAFNEELWGIHPRGTQTWQLLLLWSPRESQSPEKEGLCLCSLSFEPGLESESKCSPPVSKGSSVLTLAVTFSSSKVKQGVRDSSEAGRGSTSASHRSREQPGKKSWEGRWGHGYLQQQIHMDTNMYVYIWRNWHTKFCVLPSSKGKHLLVWHTQAFPLSGYAALCRIKQACFQGGNRTVSRGKEGDNWGQWCWGQCLQAPRNPDPEEPRAQSHPPSPQETLLSNIQDPPTLPLIATFLWVAFLCSFTVFCDHVTELSPRGATWMPHRTPQRGAGLGWVWVLSILSVKVQEHRRPMLQTWQASQRQSHAKETHRDECTKQTSTHSPHRTYALFQGGW